MPETDENLTDITITIPDTPGAQPVITPVTAEPVVEKEVKPVEKTETAQQDDSPERGLEDLKKQLADRDAQLAEERSRTLRESAERQRFERMARENYGRAEQFRSQASDATYDSVVNGLSSAQAQQEHLQSQLAEAMEKADFATASKLNGELARVGARLERLEDQKEQIETARKAPPSPEPTRQQPQETVDQFMARPWSGDEFEAYVAQRTPKTAAWLRGHQNFRDDANFRSKIVSTHDYVTKALGVAADSDAYFTKIEELSGLTPAPAPATHTQAPKEKPMTRTEASRPATPAAPPSRSTPASNGQNGELRVTLTAEERKTARQIMPPKLKPEDPDPEVLYAMRKAELMREGRIPS